MAFLDKLGASEQEVKHKKQEETDELDELDDLMFGSKPSGDKTGSSTKLGGGLSLKGKKISKEEKEVPFSGIKKVGMSGASVPKNAEYYHEYSYDAQKLPPLICGISQNPLTLYNKERISVEVSSQLRCLLFGSSKGNFMKSWKQGFYFSPNIASGLHQDAGGPCGVLAAVQAHIYKHILFISKIGKEPNLHSRTVALMAGLTDILIKAAGEPISKKQGEQSKYSILLAMPYMEPPSSPIIPAQCELYKVKATWSELHRLLCSLLSVFNDPSGQGLILFLYSVLFTHGIEKVETSRDREDCCLITEHGYASQELINLMLVGQGNSNVFNGDKIISAEGDSLTLHGIPQKSEIGFLTLYEAYRYFEVGEFYKTPKLPIWVICSESHYSVFFSDDLNTLNKLFSPFSLFYYDGLAKQAEMIELRVKREKSEVFLDKVDLSSGASIPPLEAIIYTRWSTGVSISWLNSDPIL